MSNILKRVENLEHGNHMMKTVVEEIKCIVKKSMKNLENELTSKLQKKMDGVKAEILVIVRNSEKNLAMDLCDVQGMLESQKHALMDVQIAQQQTIEEIITIRKNERNTASDMLDVLEELRSQKNELMDCKTTFQSLEDKLKKFKDVSTHHTKDVMHELRVVKEELKVVKEELKVVKEESRVVKEELKVVKEELKVVKGKMRNAMDECIDENVVQEDLLQSHDHHEKLIDLCVKPPCNIGMEVTNELGMGEGSRLWNPEQELKNFLAEREKRAAEVELELTYANLEKEVKYKTWEVYNTGRSAQIDHVPNYERLALDDQKDTFKGKAMTTLMNNREEQMDKQINDLKSNKKRHQDSPRYPSLKQIKKLQKENNRGGECGTNLIVLSTSAYPSSTSSSDSNSSGINPIVPSTPMCPSLTSSSNSDSSASTPHSLKSHFLSEYATSDSDT